MDTKANIESAGVDDLREFMGSRLYVAGMAELIEQGFTRSRIKNWIRHGRLVQVFHGVYSYGRDVETREAAWRAALVAAGPGAALAARSACEGWGTVRQRQVIPSLIEVVTESGNATTHRGLSPALRRTRVKVSTRSLGQNEVTHHDGLKLESAPMALIDLLVGASEIEVKFAFLEACRLGFFNRPDVDYSARRIYGRRGATKLRPLLALWVPELSRTRSPLEGLFLLEWAARDSRMPKVNERIFGKEVDLYWPEARLVVELDGGAFHSDPVARRRDEMKARYLEAKGLRVSRYPYDAVRYEPATVIQEVTGLLKTE